MAPGGGIEGTRSAVGPSLLAETGWEAESPLILGIGSGIIFLGAMLFVGSSRRHATDPN